MDSPLLETLLASSLRESVLVAVLSGALSPDSIMQAIEQTDGDVRQCVERILRDPLFLREVEKARERIDETVVGWFKKRGLTYAKAMDKLTKNQDPRVAFQATKDLLDRIGTKPEARLAVSGMDQYKALLKDLVPEKENERSDKTGN